MKLLCTHADWNIFCWIIVTLRRLLPFLPIIFAYISLHVRDTKIIFGFHTLSLPFSYSFTWFLLSFPFLPTITGEYEILRTIRPGRCLSGHPCLLTSLLIDPVLSAFHKGWRLCCRKAGTILGARRWWFWGRRWWFSGVDLSDNKYMKFS